MFGPWIVVFAYLVPMIGTVAQIWRRAGQIWRIGESLRALLPDDRIYRKVREWDTRFVAWKRRYPLTSYASFNNLNFQAGRLEYTIGHVRDYTIGLYMMGRFVYTVTVLVFYGNPALREEQFAPLFYYGFFALLSLWTYRRHVGIGLKMTEFLRVNPHVHPQEFFDHYYRRLGPLAVPVPHRATRTIDPTNVSHLTDQQPRFVKGPLFHGFYDTAIFARSAYRALETLGPEYGREAFDALASFWGSRMLQLFQCKLEVIGWEKLSSLDGKIILLSNHKTHLDFVFNFFALSRVRLGSGRGIRPRYLAAKDHFVDNSFVHSGLGVGKLIEQVGMVFVDRKGRGRRAIEDAAKNLLERDVDISIYPQGTRALGNEGPKGERRDAGYYTTGTANSLKSELGHLKKGCAYLAVDAALALRDHPEVKNIHLVFIGIEGVADVIPKGSFKVQTEGRVTFRIGDVMTLGPQDVEGISRPTGDEPENEAEKKYQPAVQRILKEIDRGLLRALNLHEKLTRRFLDEMKEFGPKDQLLKINHALAEAARQENHLPFMILDRTYALPTREQAEFLKRLADHLLNHKDLVSLRDEVTDKLFTYRGGELKTVVLQEQSRRVA